MKSQPIIYLDHAATTPMHADVFAAMEPWLRTEYGNPSSPYALGHAARKAIDDSRTSIARFLNCAPQEIIFTSGGTESDNLAILGSARQHKTGHVITTSIEHPAVLDACRALEQEGFRVTYLPVQKNGIVDVQVCLDAIQEDTILVSVMTANNEIGTIQPITELTQQIKVKYPHILVHTDACQAAGELPLNIQELGVDLLTINASKIYGPKGVGALYTKRGTKLQPLMYGGEQERSLRPGTENVAGIVGFAKALELAHQDREQESLRLTQLRNRLTAGILEAIPNTQLNGDPQQRLANNVNILLEGVDGEALLFYLDQEGICASLGSACTAGSLEPSHVLLALGYSREQARQSIRFTLGRSTTQEQITHVLTILPPIVQKLRST